MKLKRKGSHLILRDTLVKINQFLITQLFLKKTCFVPQNNLVTQNGSFLAVEVTVELPFDLSVAIIVVVT